MTRSIAARIHTAALRAENGQGTVEYVDLAKWVGVCSEHRTVVGRWPCVVPDPQRKTWK